MNEQGISAEVRQLAILGSEIDEQIELPPTPEEQAEAKENERQQDINSASMDIADTQYTQMVAMGVNSAWTMAFPNWQALDRDAELMPMAELTRMIIDKHFPNIAEKAGPEVMLGMIALTAISARAATGVPPRGKIIEQGADDEQS
ncbi:hypothetical protein EES38_21495 [Vibrio viridaestus]|uniref:Uncharacterized protein n=2 Tax=Vibrio viridaestus TaxID=2487322 RepID=A0A3N9U057_9VIBR|nr:hypothetical protein EES38_21495 [Vibrio viridaestus]